MQIGLIGKFRKRKPIRELPLFGMTWNYSGPRKFVLRMSTRHCKRDIPSVVEEKRLQDSAVMDPTVKVKGSALKSWEKRLAEYFHDGHKKVGILSVSKNLRDSHS